MNALAIDCAVSKMTVAAKKDKNIVKVTYDIGIKQSEKLLPDIDFVMKEAGLTPAELDYTCTTLGPGTFTGLRLGLSALKALNLANGTPVYGIPSLDAYAHPYSTAVETVLSVIEAKEDEFFYAFYLRGEKLREEEDKEIEEILKQIDAESCVMVCGPGAKTFTDRTSEITPLYSVHSFNPQGDCTESLFEMTEKMIADKISPMEDYDGPLYVRKSEAEIVLEQKQAGK